MFWHRKARTEAPKLCTTRRFLSSSAVNPILWWFLAKLMVQLLGKAIRDKNFMSLREFSIIWQMIIGETRSHALINLQRRTFVQGKTAWICIKIPWYSRPLDHPILLSCIGIGCAATSSHPSSLSVQFLFPFHSGFHYVFSNLERGNDHRLHLGLPDRGHNWLSYSPEANLLLWWSHQLWQRCY